jgi:serine/threonine protein kinase
MNTPESNRPSVAAEIQNLIAIKDPSLVVTFDLRRQRRDAVAAFILVSLLTAGLLACLSSSQSIMAAIFSLHSVSQLSALLPLVFSACFMLGLVTIWVAKESRSVPVDWSETDLILGRTNKTPLLLPWASIKSLKEIEDWDLINGKQAAFLLSGKMHVSFRMKLKQSDILLKHDISSFLTAIRSHAPQVELQLNSLPSQSDSYTELWLQYFSTGTSREKKALLQKNMRLGNNHYEIVGTIGGGGQGTTYLAVYHANARTGQVCSASAANPETAENAAAKTGDASMEVAVTAVSTGTSSAKGYPTGLANHLFASEAVLLHDQDQVVLKEYVLPVHKSQAIADRTAQKLKSEVDILSRLNHPQIVKLKDAFIEDYRGYLVLEYIFGESLKAVVEKTGPQPESIVVPWMLSACQILQYMHELTPPVVHRDITPDNLMLDVDGTIKIVDFNVAHQVDSSSTATVVGKHAYIPPEQFRGKPTPQSDIYALGGSMHFLLTGKDPEPITVSHPRSLNPSTSERLDTIVAKATAHKLSDRYASINEMAEDLRAFVRAGASSSEVPASH